MREGGAGIRGLTHRRLAGHPITMPRDCDQNSQHRMGQGSSHRLLWWGTQQQDCPGVSDTWNWQGWNIIILLAEGRVGVVCIEVAPLSGRGAVYAQKVREPGLFEVCQPPWWSTVPEWNGAQGKMTWEWNGGTIQNLESQVHETEWAQRAPPSPGRKASPRRYQDWGVIRPICGCCPPRMQSLNLHSGSLRSPLET